jgi:dihydrodipicolinate synthase/N-acetylneuraminate lyase
MQMRDHAEDPRRREFLRLLGAGALGFATSGGGLAAAPKPGPKSLRGVFPIGLTPITESDKLDLDCLAAEVKFCNRGRVHGFVWPQVASRWTTLTEQERLDGAEAILAAGKGGRAALVIGVQGPDLAAVTRYAKHAEKLGADAIVSLPPVNVNDEKVLLDYYQQVGRMTELPLFVQSQRTMSVDLIVDLYMTVPTIRQVKDEAGNPLQRIGEFRKRTGDQLKVFSGNNVLTMITEMELGFAGHCPTPALADVYAAAFDLWHAGKRKAAFDMFGRILAFSSLGGSPEYVMVARGIFKETTRSRAAQGGAGGAGGARGGAAAGGGGRGGLGVEEGKKAIRDGLSTYLKPYLRA